MGNWWLVIPVLLAMVMVHEFGHFVAAVWCGIKVEEVGIGLPPRLWGFRWRGIKWSICLLPIGAFVNMRGEDGDQEADPTSFSAKPAWQRAVVLVAGSAMNLVAAAGVLIAVSLLGEPVPRVTYTVEAVAAGSPAAVAGVQPGDTLLEINGRPATSATATSELPRGVPASFLIQRSTGDVVGPVSITPRTNPPADEGPMGLSLKLSVQEVTYTSYELPTAFARGWQKAGEYSRLIVTTLTEMVTGRTPVQVSGPVGLAHIVGEVVDNRSLPEFLLLVGLIGVNLAVFNLIPFPALDGGRILFVLIEMARRGKRVPARLEGAVHFGGFVLLLAFMVLITLVDVANLP